MDKQKLIIVTGGGSGGHIMPILAVVDELKKQGLKVLYVGSKNGPEAKIIPGKIDFRGIQTGKFRRYWNIQNFIDPFRVLVGFFQSLKIIFESKPSVIFSKGGYVAFPVVLAGWILRIPILTHESDASIGITNKIIAKISKRIAIAFPPKYYPNLRARKVIFTGNPTRLEFLTEGKESRKNIFKLEENLPTILAMGGSQGAHKINETIKEILPDILRHAQIIHLSGKFDYTEFLTFRKNLHPDIKSHYHLFEYLGQEIRDALSSADLVISRGGANSLAEIAALGKASIIIPLAGHQEANADFFASEKAAMMIKNKDLTADRLLSHIKFLLDNPEHLKDLRIQIKEFSTPEAAKNIASEIIKITK